MFLRLGFLLGPPRLWPSEVNYVSIKMGDKRFRHRVEKSVSLSQTLIPLTGGNCCDQGEGTLLWMACTHTHISF